MKSYTVAVVGATGAVGREMIKTLERRNFPVSELVPLASARSIGKDVIYKGNKVKVLELKKDAIPQAAVALFSAGAAISREYCPLFAGKGIFVIDNSSAFRMDKDIPLVVPEVNSDHLSRDKKLISNPNCSTIQMVLPLKVLYDNAGLKRVIVSTYQSVSGAGARGMDDLTAQSGAFLKGEKIPPAAKFPHRIAFNCIPQIDVFLDNGYTREEMKMTNETRKIIGDESIQLSATCVRVPVFRSHSEAVWVETKKKISIDAFKKLLAGADGVELVDEPLKGRYPMPIDAENNFATYVGRIREDIATTNGIVFWVVSDNLLKGAALNAVQIAEKLIQLAYL